MNQGELSYQDRQRAQYAKFKAWLDGEGGTEWPTQLKTMVSSRQVSRMQWLRKRAAGQVLEAGCNFGLVTAWVGGHAGLDANPVNIELARLLAPGVNFVVGDVRHLPYQDKSFDTVMLPEVLEHIDWPGDVCLAIEEAKRVARVRVLITVPDGSIFASATTKTDAESMKHRWLADDNEVLQMMRWLGPRAQVVRRDGFVLFAHDLHDRKKKNEKSEKSEKNEKSKEQA